MTNGVCRRLQWLAITNRAVLDANGWLYGGLLLHSTEIGSVLRLTLNRNEVYIK